MSAASQPRIGDLAVARRAGTGPTIVFLPGYASDMTGSKAMALDGWAAERGRALVRFDYRGCGASAGNFEEQTLDAWLADTLAIIDATEGSLIVVGSSMGGWLMLLAALARPDRIAALVGIAAAPDFTDWGFDQHQRRRLQEDGRIEEPSPYGPPMVTTRKFWASGQRLLLGDTIAVDAPVRLLQGQRDPEVPWRRALDLADALRSDDVQVTLIKDGDHRLSRPQDIALLLHTLETLPS